MLDLFHMRRTLLSAAPKSLEIEIKDRLNEVFEAQGYEDALNKARKLLVDFEGRAQAFVDKFRRHSESPNRVNSPRLPQDYSARTREDPRTGFLEATVNCTTKKGFALTGYAEPM